MKIELDGHMVSSIVVQDLQGYYEIMQGNPDAPGICEAIERILLDYMAKPEYDKWIRSVKLTELAESDAELI